MEITDNDAADALVVNDPLSLEVVYNSDQTDFTLNYNQETPMARHFTVTAFFNAAFTHFEKKAFSVIVCGSESINFSAFSKYLVKRDGFTHESIPKSEYKSLLSL